MHAAVPNLRLVQSSRLAPLPHLARDLPEELLQAFPMRVLRAGAVTLPLVDQQEKSAAVWLDSVYTDYYDLRAKGNRFVDGYRNR